MRTKPKFLGRWKCSCGAEGRFWVRVWRVRRNFHQHVARNKKEKEKHVVSFETKLIEDLEKEGGIYDIERRRIG